LVITPVKDSLKTTKQTIQSVYKASGDFKYIIYNDFSGEETKQFLETNKTKFRYDLVNIEDLTTNPSPNYKLVLQLAREKAVELNIPIVIIESDVIIKKDTITNLLEISKQDKQTGMVGAVTVNEEGNYNFPYDYLGGKSPEVRITNRSLSFCCTLLTCDLLNKFSFEKLSSKKDWFDIYISRQSKKLGFRNYLAKNNEVLHLPHSSRPWKQLKYTHPLKYYFFKYLKKRDRI
jgi:GT2 family glycosyltransferase